MLVHLLTCAKLNHHPRLFGDDGCLMPTVLKPPNIHSRPPLPLGLFSMFTDDGGHMLRKLSLKGLS